MRYERIVILIKKLALVSDKQALDILSPIDLTPSQYIVGVNCTLEDGQFQFRDSPMPQTGRLG